MAITVSKALRKARSLARRGDSAAAARLYRDILAQFPQNREAITGLAQLQGKGGKLRGSAPGPSRDTMNQLVALYQRGLLDEALQAGIEVARRFPDDPLIHNFLGVVSAANQQPDTAIDHYRQAVTLQPDYAEALCNFGICLQTLHRHSEARQRFEEAVEAEPDNVNALLGLAGCLKTLGRYGDAVKHYRTCLALRPEHAATYNNLGNCLHALGQFDAATTGFRKAIALEPGNADAYYNLGHSLFEQDNYPEACVAYEQALALNPQLNDARAKLAHVHALTCDWRDEPTEALRDLGLTGEAVSPFPMLAIDARPGQQRARAAAYAQQRFGNIVPLPAPHPVARNDKRLRIGYFSADFHEHATMFLMISQLEAHDRSRFDIHAFSYGPSPDDAMNRRVRAAVEHYHDVRTSSDEDVARLARQLGIDIAVDLKGYTQHGRCGIFAFRAAPVQISYLGYPGTLALPTMDYLLADATVIPEPQARHYTESIICLPNSYQVNDHKRPIAPRCPTRTEAGLPESGVVFCSFNNAYKIRPPEFAIWMRLLEQVPGSVLWLLAGRDEVAVNLRREAAAHGIDPQRLVFASRCPNPEHLARHALADLFLDCFNYNAHTTASDALWAGLPVLTTPGESFASRVGASLLTAVGLPELIASDDREYEDIALSLARNPQQLRELRQRLQANRLQCPLFDTQRFTRDLETAYRLVWEKHLAGRKPAHIAVPPTEL